MITTGPNLPAPLTDKDYARAALLLRCEVAVIKAVAEVESAGSGFLKNGKLRILFEGHKFYRFTNGKYAATNPNICHPDWDRTKYCKGNSEIRGVCELKRLAEAKSLDSTAALLSCSVGKFQIMGFNFGVCGFRTVEDFWNAHNESEAAHLIAFCEFVKSSKIDAALREHDWAKFARRYNGPAYAENAYDSKLAAAYAKYAAKEN